MLFAKVAVASILAALAVVASPVRDAAAIDRPLSPTVIRGEEELEKRQATEGVHLMYCSGGTTSHYTVVVYCANDGNCNFYPSAANRCVWGGTSAPLWVGTGACTFTTSVTFSWNISASAYSAPDFSIVGTGNNGSPWTIRRDDDHQMFTDPNGHKCVSEFYCLK